MVFPRCRHDGRNSYVAFPDGVDTYWAGGIFAFHGELQHKHRTHLEFAINGCWKFYEWNSIQDHFYRVY